jgi:hypothetical protein
MAIKAVEFDKAAHIYVQIMVYIEPEDKGRPHVHLCGWFPARKPGGQFTKEWNAQEEQEIPNTGGSRGFWIPNKDFRPIDTLVRLLKK